MEWSNDRVMEFLELYRMEPCLWNPNLPLYKSRSVHSDAWQRIMKALKFKVTREQLKNKKDSLMGYYRIHLNRYKKLLQSDAGHTYKTSWFAFEFMDSFLGPIYGTKLIKDDEADEDTSITEEYICPENFEHTSASSTAIPANSSNTEGESARVANPRKVIKLKRPIVIKSVLDINNDVRQMSDTITNLKSITSKREVMDEYDHFAHMIASKIRKIHNLDERETVMNTIQNLTFQCYMKQNENNKK